MGICDFKRAEASSVREPSRFMSRCSWSSGELKMKDERGRVAKQEKHDAPVHHNDLAHPLIQATFYKERGVKYTHLLSPDPIREHRPEHRPPHGGMHDAIQLFPLRLIVEDDRAQFLAVEVPVW